MFTCKNKKLNIILISVFIVVSVIIFFVLKFEKDGKVEQYLENKTKIYNQNYDVTYDNYKRLAKVIFHTRINKQETIDILSNMENLGKNITRDLLYDSLLKEYELLKQYNLKQLHFHLPNNESFLRFHRPQKFGDNLTKVRETVNYVNTNKKAVNGFEEGRIYNGYRFVFPIKDKGTHLGSVEISFSTLAMAKDIIANYNVIANFLILKEKVDQKLFLEERTNYIHSSFPLFYMEKKAYEYIKAIGKSQREEKVSKRTKKTVSEFFKSNDEAISTFSPALGKVLTLIKVKNPVTKESVGIFIIKSDAQYIYNKRKNFYVAVAISELFLILLLLFIKEEIKYRNQIKEDHKEIERLNGNLQSEIDEAVENLRVKEILLAQKSKMAAMGEMIDSIAHQWMQPISIIKLKLQMLQMEVENGKSTNNSIIKSVEDSEKQIRHLTDTIKEFRTFFRPSNEKQIMSLKVLIDSALILIKDELVKHTIKTKIIGDTDVEVAVTGNEFKHVIINLVNNAKDAFIENDIKDREIIFDVKSNGHIILNITDNAGGIPKDAIDKVFDAHFTTKGEQSGTGIGLYMTKQIIEKMDANISVSNVENGASFKIEMANNNLI